MNIDSEIIMSGDIQIGDRWVGVGHPSLIIGELSANHVGSLHVAKQTIRAMAEAGADAVKIQTDTLLEGTGSTIDCKNDYFTIRDGSIWDGANLYDLFMETYTPLEWHQPLKELSEELGLLFFSTPYSPESADFLDELGVPAYKIASMELVDRPFLEYVAQKGKPLVLSRGMSEFDDIKKAVEICRDAGNNQVIVLHCISEYPTKLEDANVSVVPRIMDDFGVISGVSDHTPGIEVPVASTVLGGRVIEKHVILDRKLGGPDASFSLDISEFKHMVESVRNAEKALGDGNYELPKKVKNQSFTGRSLFVVKDVEKGERFTKENVRSIRPGDGMDPNRKPDILGKTATRKISRGTPLSPRFISNL